MSLPLQTPEIQMMEKMVILNYILPGEVAGLTDTETEVERATIT